MFLGLAKVREENFFTCLAAAATKDLAGHEKQHLWDNIIIVRLNGLVVREICKNAGQ